MQEIHLNTIQDFNDYNGMDTLHPLVSVIRVDNTEHIKEYMMHYGFYAIYLKENKGCKLSYGYFGTLVKTETGRTAKDLINDRILAKAKELLSISSPKGGGREGATISQRLGFEYPQHFVRFFKALTGKTPTQWRAA